MSKNKETEEAFVSEEELLLKNDRGDGKRYKFAGKILAPFNRTYKELAIAASKETDSNTFYVWLALYGMVRGEEIYQAALVKFGSPEAAEDEIDAALPIEVEDDIEGYRAAVRKWSRRFTDAQATTASAMLLEMYKRMEAGQIVSSGEGSGAYTDKQGK